MTLKFRIPYKCNICGHINFDIKEWHPGMEEFRSHSGWLYPSCACNKHAMGRGYAIAGTPQQFSGMVASGTDVYNTDILTCINSIGDQIKVVCKYREAQREIVTVAGDQKHTCSIYGFYFEYVGIKTFPIVNNYLGKHDLEILTVIGNTIEHPELLNQ